MTNNLEGDPCEASHQDLVLVLEARVLSSVARFLTGRPLHQSKGEQDGPRPVWHEWSCVQDLTKRCLADVLRSVACCFLFQLSRHASTAMLVMRSGLYKFLLDECRRETSAFLSSPVQDAITDPHWDARDLAIAVDAFDWSTHALWTALQRDGAGSHAFLVPVGARTLAHVLRGHQLPMSEVDEYGLLQSSRHIPPPVSPVRSSAAHPFKNKTAKPRRLPSMFSFPTQTNGASAVCPVCCPHQNAPQWTIVSLASTALHFATRALVLLALHIPQTAPEGKTWRRNGGLEMLQLVSTSTLPPSPSSTAASLGSHEEKSGEKDLDWRAIRRMAQAGRSLFETSDSRDLSNSQSMAPSRKDATMAIRSRLGDKLQAITQQTRLETSQQRHTDTTAAREAKRTALHSRVHAAYTKAMATRGHLLGSLAVLTSGRVHPAAHDQTLTDWLGSFPTIETREQQRHEQQAMRQRRLLDQQFQLDARRRRERDERTEMAQNDSDTRDTFAVERAAAQREAFASFQHEMRAMQAREADEERKEDAVVAAREEMRRRQVLVEMRRHQAREEALMTKEDHYYANKILREKQQQHEAQATQMDRIDPLAEQQKRIERVRRRDEETKRTAVEQSAMRSEDLRGRQRRFFEAETLKTQRDWERTARRQMEAEEQWLRWCWKQIDEAVATQRLAVEKQRRVDARRQRREPARQWSQWQRAWVTLYDAAGNLYYYNHMTGASQWEAPLTQWAEDDTIGDAAASWPGTS